MGRVESWGCLPTPLPVTALMIRLTPPCCPASRLPPPLSPPQIAEVSCSAQTNAANIIQKLVQV